ncbi:MAG: hypothetical protein IZT59_10840 [Verrucomicrobia bacterium]|nr:hypothetical protein [Verrucomicrobiota bacterium]
MSCIWKKSKSEPCSCAFRLGCPAAEILDHLHRLGRGTLVARRQGLSLASQTAFGLSVTCGDKDGDVLRDHISGLETDTSAPIAIYLMTSMPAGKTLLAFGESGKSIGLSFRLDAHHWGSPAVSDLLRRFDAAPLPCTESRKLGAGAWLDEWSSMDREEEGCHLARTVSESLRHCPMLEVTIRTYGQRQTRCFVPSFIDYEGSVIRIADKACHNVAYADLRTKGVRLESNGIASLKISPETSA